MSPNAAMTSSENTQQKIRNRRLPVLPMYCSIIRPMDLPSLLTDAYREPKSCTAPKNTPPTRIHSRAGSQPNMAAMMGPVTGPAPAMVENWCAKTTDFGVGI